MLVVTILLALAGCDTYAISAAVLSAIGAITDGCTHGPVTFASAIKRGINRAWQFTAVDHKLAVVAMCLAAYYLAQMPAGALASKHSGYLQYDPGQFGMHPISTTQSQLRRNRPGWQSVLKQTVRRSNPGVELAFASAAGLTAGQVFLDSCCSRTIIHDKELLTNLRTLPQAKSILGIGGYRRITQTGDLQLKLVDVQGKTRAITVPDVYYDPAVTCNLLSVSDMCKQQYTSTFDVSGSTITGPEVNAAAT